MTHRQSTHQTQRRFRAGLAPVLIAILSPWIGSAQGQTRGEPDLIQAHIEAARRTLAAHLRSEGLKPEKLDLEPLGEAALFPAHSRRHRRQPGSGPASIAGRVLDATGAVIPGATVTAAAPGARPIPVQTDPSGEFRIEDLAPGRVTVEILLPGFKRAVYFLKLEPGETLQLLPRLEIGSHLEAITLGEEDLDPQLPRAIVPLGVQVSPTQFRPFLVFDGGPWSGPVYLTPDHYASQLPLSRAEYDDARMQLQTFYDDLLDLSAGTDRFVRYISDEVVEYWRSLAQNARSRGESEPLLPPAELADSAFREWLALWLEHSVYDAWRRFERLPEPEAPPAEPGHPEVRDYMERRIAALRRQLDALGVEDAAHRAVADPYLRRVLGEGLLVKQQIELDGGRALGPVYKTRLLPYLILNFGRRDGRLRIVHLVVDD